MKSSVISLVFLCLFMSAFQVQAQTWSPAETEVFQVLEECNRIYKEENLEALAATCYHDDYVRFRNGAPSTFNKADVLQVTPIWWANDDLVLWYVKPLAIRIVGNVAVVHYFYYATMQSKDGKQRYNRSRFTDVWVKQDGKWLKIADHGGTDPS